MRSVVPRNAYGIIAAVQTDGASSDESPAEGLSYAFDMVKFAAALAAASAGVLCATFVVVAVVLGVLLGGGSYGIAAGEDAWRGWTALTFGIVCALLAAGFLATRFAVLHTVSKLIRKAALGEEILKHLLAACGVSEVPGERTAPAERTEGALAAVRTQLESAGLASELHGLPVRELKPRVQVVVARSVDHQLLARPPLQWIAGGVRRVLVWAVVRVVVKLGVSDPKAAHPCVDLPRLRTQLGANFDEMIIDQVNGGRVRLIWQVCLLATALSMSIAGAIRAVPG